MFHLHLVFYVKVAFYSVLTTDGQMNICQTWEKLCVITTPPTPPCYTHFGVKDFWPMPFSKNNFPFDLF